MDIKITWTDVEDIGIALYEAHPDRDPLSLRFTELRNLVENLPEFEPKPGQSVNEKILEQIQKFWYEEFLDNQ